MIKRGLLSKDLNLILEKSEAELMRLSGAHILITGSSGFMGFWFAAALLEANSKMNLNIQVTITARDYQSVKDFQFYNLGDPLRILNGDLFTADKLFLKKMGSFDLVFHSAISNNINSNNSDLSRDLLFLEKFLKCAELKGSKFLFPSSGAIYGEQPTNLDRIPENLENESLLGPRTKYGNFKAKSEELIRMANITNGIVGITPRFFTLFGPRLPLDRQFAIGNFINMAKRGERILVNGNRESKRSYLYIADAMYWLLKASHLNPSAILHFGSNEIINIEELALLISNKFGSNLNPSIAPGEIPISNYVPQNAQTRKILNAVGGISFNQGLERWNEWLDLV